MDEPARLPARPEPPATCRLCGAALPPGWERCSRCGLHQSTDLPPTVRWRFLGGVVAVYAVVAVLLAVTE